MSRFLSARFLNLKAYVPGEQPRDFNYIKLNTNESPYPPARQVIDALSRDEAANLRLYSDPECLKLRETLAAYYGVKPKNILIGNGSDEILSFIFMAFCDKNTGVAYPDISYGFYPVFSNLYGIKKNEIHLHGDFSICVKDYSDLESTVVIANPNAPTGICLSPEDVEKIVKSNPDNVVVIDEAYIDFGGTSVIPLTKKYENLLVVQTYSKSRSLAGARLGYAIGDEALIADLDMLRNSTNPYNVNRLSLIAGKAAVEAQAYYDRNNAEIVDTREYTCIMLRDMGFVFTDSKANFIFVKHPALTGKELYLGLREREILVRFFDKPRISDYVRITIGTKNQMDELLEALKEMLDK